MARGTRRTISGGNGRAHARCRPADATRSSIFSRARNSANSMARRTAPRLRPRQQRTELVAQGEQAGWLQPDHRQGARQPAQGAPGLGARLLDHARREKRAAAAQRTAACDRHVTGAIAGGRQHTQRRAQVLRLEIAVERVGQQQHLAARLAAGARSSASASRKKSRRHAGRRRAAATPSQRSPIRRSSGTLLRRLASGARRASERRVTRQLGDQRLARATPCRSARAASTSIFIFAMSTPVGHSRRHALHDTHSASCRPACPRPSRRRQAGRSAPAAACWRAAGQVLLVAGDAEGRAHHAGIECAAGAVVVAHLDRAQHAAERPGMLRPVQFRCEIARRRVARP
jgi:hypothetical protein